MGGRGVWIRKEPDENISFYYGGGSASFCWASPVPPAAPPHPRNSFDCPVGTPALSRSVNRAGLSPPQLASFSSLPSASSPRASPPNPTPGRADQQIFAFLQPCLALPPDLADRPGAGWSSPHRPAHRPEARCIQVKRARMAPPQ